MSKPSSGESSNISSDATTKAVSDIKSDSEPSSVTTEQIIAILTPDKTTSTESNGKTSKLSDTRSSKGKTEAVTELTTITDTTATSSSKPSKSSSNKSPKRKTEPSSEYITKPYSTLTNRYSSEYETSIYDTPDVSSPELDTSTKPIAKPRYEECIPSDRASTCRFYNKKKCEPVYFSNKPGKEISHEDRCSRHSNLNKPIEPIVVATPKEKLKQQSKVKKSVETPKEQLRPILKGTDYTTKHHEEGTRVSIYPSPVLSDSDYRNPRESTERSTYATTELTDSDYTKYPRESTRRSTYATTELSDFDSKKYPRESTELSTYAITELSDSGSTKYSREITRVSTYATTELSDSGSKKCPRESTEVSIYATTDSQKCPRESIGVSTYPTTELSDSDSKKYLRESTGVSTYPTTDLSGSTKYPRESTGVSTYLTSELSESTPDLTSRMQHFGIVPDLISSYPSDTLEVVYPTGVKAQLGNILTPTQVKDKPLVRWDAGPDSFYLLCMTDLDSPSRKNPKYREWHHWLVGNIPGDQINKGQTLSQYISAVPPRGTGQHRYVFLVYLQQDKINFDEPILTNKTGDRRAKFSTNRIAKKYRLDDPIAGNFFLAEWDNYVPKVYKQLKYPPCLHLCPDD